MTGCPEIQNVLFKFRDAIENTNRGFLPITFRNFPSGACGDTCQILAEHLKGMGFGDFFYISGKREDSRSHAWLEKDGFVIDLTSDQFNELDMPVYYGPINDWYRSFSEESRSLAGYTLFQFDDETPKIECLELMKAHRAIAENICA